MHSLSWKRKKTNKQTVRLKVHQTKKCLFVFSLQINSNYWWDTCLLYSKTNHFKVHELLASATKFCNEKSMHEIACSWAIACSLYMIKLLNKVRYSSYASQIS